MVNTTLRDYLDELNLLLEQEALEEVIGHCRHILQHFPKNVETYRLLGRALLERGRHAEAADVFQRVLSSVPDDFVSHLGLSSVSEEQQQIPTAIWHLECAYEQDPNNTALQGELKRLYEQRDGAMPDRIQLTKGALIRIYAKSQLYDQTLKELENALQQTPDRFDLLQLQAKTLWDSGHPVEAADSALQILEKLPNNIEANRIMASLWLKGGRPSEAEGFVSRLEQLDPFKAWATVHPDGRPLPHDAFQLPHLDWDVRAAAAMATDVPDWVNAIGNVFDAPESVALGGSANWLDDAPSSGRASASPFDLGGRQRGPEPEAEPASSVQMPDWMEDLIPGGSTPFTQSPIADSDVPVWFTDDSPASDSSTTGIAGLPAWFEEAVGGPGEGSSSTPALPNWLDEDDKAEAQLLTDAGEPPRTVPSLDAMSWLATGPLPPLEDSLGSKHDSDFDNKSPAYMDLSTKPAEPSDDLPDLDLSWFDSASAQPSVPQAKSPSEPMAISDLDWLHNDGDSEPSEMATGDADYPIEQGSLPDWLGASANESESAEMDEESAQSDEENSEIDWLSNMPNLGATGTEAVQPEQPTIDLDWLNDMSSLDTPGAQPSQPAEEVQPAEASSGPDWLNSMPSFAQPAEEVQPAEASSGLDWLSSMPELDSLGTQPAAEDVRPAEASSGLDWLSSMPELDSLGTQPAEDIQPAEASSDLDWLSSMPELDSLGTQPSQVEDIQPAEASSGLDWLSSMPSLDTLGTQPAEDVQPAEASSGLDWLSSMPELDSLGTQPAAEDVQPAEASSGLDWLSSMPELDSLGTQPAEDVQPAEASSGLDWLSDMPSLDTLGSEPAAEDVQPAEASSSLDWLSSMPELDSLGTQPAEEVQPAEASSGLDWLSDMPSLDTLGTEPAQAAEEVQPAEASSDLDWLSSMPELDSLGTQPAEDVQPAEASSDLDWLSSMPELDSLGTQPAEDVQPAEASSGLDWLSDMPELDSLGTQPAAEDVQPAEAGSGLDWLSSMPELDSLGTQPAEDVQPAEASSGLDWLSSMPGLDSLGTEPAEEVQSAEANSGLDWLSSMPSLDTLGTQPAAEEVQPAEASSGLDWPSSMPELDSLGTEPAEDVQPAEANSGLDWLSSMPELDSLGTQPAEEVQPAEASSGLDWLSDMPSLDTLGMEPAQTEDIQPAEASSELDWLSSMPSLDTLGTEPAQTEDIQPAEASSELDWLSSMPSLASSDSESANEVQPAEASSGLDWLNNMPELDSLGVESAQPADEVQPAEASTSLNWLSDLPSLDSLGVDPAQPAEANSGLDWLSSMPRLDSLDEGTEAIPAQAVDDDLGLDWLNSTPADSLMDTANTGEQDNGLYELHGKTSEETPAGWSLDQAMVEISAEPADDGDPLAWMHGGQSLPDTADEKPNDDNSPVAAAPPAWLTAMMPPMPGEDSGEPAPTPKVSLDQLDFGGLNRASVNDTDFTAEEPITPTNDWLSSLDNAPSPAPSLDWLGQTTTPEQPPVELEDDWLASFESPANAAPSQAAQPSNGQSMFDDTASDSALPDLDWLTGGSATDNTADTPVTESNTGETVASAADDWLSSFGMGAADSAETPVEDLPLQMDESAEPASNQWMSTLGIDIPAEEPALENDTPSWMASEQPSPKDEEQTENEWVGPDGKDHFNSMIMRVGDLSSTSTPRAPKDTGVLEPNAAPDWLTALHDEAGDQPSSATESADAEQTWQPSPASNLTSTEAAGTLSADSTPDWMMAFEPEPENKVADPANLVDTSIHEGTPSPSFAFDRTPKWMRKKSETGSLSKPANNDPAWRRDAEPKDNSDTDTPDWLR